MQTTPDSAAGLTHVDQYLAVGKESGASDIHLSVNSPPIWRRFGLLEPIWLQAAPLTSADTENLAMGFLTEPQKELLASRGDVDFAYATDIGRFRASVVRQRTGYDLVFRIISDQVRSMDELGLPEQLKLLTEFHNGLVLVTGSVGSGKSTTLAALVDQINRNRHDHIITLEDPIEYLHTNKKSIVTQREVAIDTRDFLAALRAVMREDPDVILIGEMRDAETFQAAISAAETGHLVFSTLHTTNVMMTIDRIMDMFPSNMHAQVRSQLALQLRACISQRLLPAADTRGRVPAIEVMISNPGIAGLIRDNNVKQIPNAIAGGAEDGMQTFNMSLAGLLRQRLIREDDALIASDNPDELKMNMQGIYLSQGRGGILKK